MAAAAHVFNAGPPTYSAVNTKSDIKMILNMVLFQPELCQVILYNAEPVMVQPIMSMSIPSELCPSTGRTDLIESCFLTFPPR